ncbi:MAG: c-type cytochrome [Puniceicoccaceae bacterium]
MRYFFAVFFFSIVATVTILGFRGDSSEKEPWMIFPDMDDQPRYKPQGTNEYFGNRMNDRPRPANTVIRGQEWDVKEIFDSAFATDEFTATALNEGKNADGSWAEDFPIEVTNSAMELGRKKYEIFCHVCHGAAGDGKGVTSQYGILASDLRLEMYRDMAGGEIFNTITHGKNTMYGYGDKLTPEERWAVVLYVRALQLSQNASIEQVPADKRKELGL